MEVNRYVKVVETTNLVSKGDFPFSFELFNIREDLYKAIHSVDWPHGSGSFTIYPESGKQRGHGNGVKPIKDAALEYLCNRSWKSEYPWPGTGHNKPGKIDAVLETTSGIIALEWETGNISSSHRSLNKMCVGLASGVLKAGFVIVPSRQLYKFLTDRIANITELEPYFSLWSAIDCEDGILEIITVEQDSTSIFVPRIPKMTDGRALY